MYLTQIKKKLDTKKSNSRSNKFRQIKNWVYRGRIDDGQCDIVPYSCTKFEGKFMLALAFTPQSLDVITAGSSHGDLRYFWTVHNPIHATEHLLGFYGRFV